MLAVVLTGALCNVATEIVAEHFTGGTTNTITLATIGLGDADQGTGRAAASATDRQACRASPARRRGQLHLGSTVLDAGVRLRAQFARPRDSAALFRRPSCAGRLASSASRAPAPTAAKWRPRRASRATALVVLRSPARLAAARAGLAAVGRSTLRPGALLPGAEGLHRRRHPRCSAGFKARLDARRVAGDFMIRTAGRGSAGYVSSTTADVVAFGAADRASSARPTRLLRGHAGGTCLASATRIRLLVPDALVEHSATPGRAVPVRGRLRARPAGQRKIDPSPRDPRPQP